MLAALQMEDATPSLQMLRERVDVAKALQTAWLREAAAKVGSVAQPPDEMLPPLQLLCGLGGSGGRTQDGLVFLGHEILCSQSVVQGAVACALLASCSMSHAH